MELSYDLLEENETYMFEVIRENLNGGQPILFFATLNRKYETNFGELRYNLGTIRLLDTYDLQCQHFFRTDVYDVPVRDVQKVLCYLQV